MTAAIAPQRTFAADAANRSSGLGFSDATRDVCVARIVAWRRRSAQAGNRGVGLAGSFVAMGI
jgi:hypothetical protein